MERCMKNLDELIKSTELPYRNRCEKGVVAFVHAKGQSERIPSKNLKILGDKPLFCHAICNAKSSLLVDEVVIDSDDDEILSIGVEYGALPLKRPYELANNMTTGDELAYWQACNFPLSEIVVQVIPTAPFLSSQSINSAISMLKKDCNLDSVAGVFEEALYKWIDGVPAYFNVDGTIPNSTELEKTLYETTGMYANHTSSVLKTKKRLNPENCKPYMVRKIESLDINTMEDFELAEMVWKGVHGT